MANKLFLIFSKSRVNGTENSVFYPTEKKNSFSATTRRKYRLIFHIFLAGIFCSLAKKRKLKVFIVYFGKAGRVILLLEN